jgi:hypothetical protein
MTHSDHPVVEAHHRLDHALIHCEALDRRVRSFMEREPLVAVADHDIESGHYIIRGHIREPLPMDFGFIAGDAIHNIRASLDNLYWAFAVRHNDPPDNMAAFPVIEKATGKRGWESKQSRIVNDVGIDVAMVLQSVQPFEISKGDPSVNPLWVLNRLWNDDKHRRVIPVAGAASPETMSGPFRVRGFRGPYIRRGPFTDGDALAGFSYDPAGGLEGTPKFDVAFYVAFPQDGPVGGARLSDSIRALHDYVRRVVRRFENL